VTVDRRAALRTGVLVLAGLLSAIVAEAQTPPPYGLVTKPKFRKIVNALGNFDVEVPDSGDWKLIPGHPGSVLTLADTKTGNASVIVERIALRGALSPENYVFAAQAEAETIRERQPGATNVQQQVFDASGRRFVVVQYVRPGIKGPEQVVLYAFPIGATLYRVMCGAVQTDFGKYAIIFGHIAASFHSPPTDRR
jgi:hypothetical protein